MEIAALLSLPNLIWTFVISTVAEAGYVLIGLGLGGAAGDTGAYMHLGYQAAMRGLVLMQPAGISSTAPVRQT